MEALVNLTSVKLGTLGLSETAVYRIMVCTLPSVFLCLSNWILSYSFLLVGRLLIMHFLNCFPSADTHILIRLWCKSRRHEIQRRELNVSVNGRTRIPGSTETFLMPSFLSMMLEHVVYYIDIQCAKDIEEKFSRQLVYHVFLFLKKYSIVFQSHTCCIN